MLPIDNLLIWFSTFGRQFPWRFTGSPYKVLVSEVLLQQTDAGKVIDPYQRIIEKFPTIVSLANADDEVIVDIFSKIGLFFRASRLKTIAEEIINKYNAVFPSNLHDLKSIIGIGNYIGNSILCFGLSQKRPIVDTNIIRIFSRYGLYKSTKKRPHTDMQLWDYAESILPDKNFVEYNYSLLDLGATVCTSRNPYCESCPINKTCDMAKTIIQF